MNLCVGGNLACENVCEQQQHYLRVHAKGPSIPGFDSQSCYLDGYNHVT